MESRGENEKTRQTKVKSDLQEEELLYQREGSRAVAVAVAVVLLLLLSSSESAEHAAFEAWEANAASAEDEAEHWVRVESPARKRRRRASGRSL